MKKPLRPKRRPLRAPPRKAPVIPGQRRLQQVLAAAGLGSRRECENLITEGRIEVDSVQVTQLGTRVDPDTQKILVDGMPLRLERKQYFMLNKPPGVVSTSRDPSGRLRVIDLIKSEARVYCVGRLDRTSEGLILVTNDGELANRLTHPSFQIDKRYLVEVAGTPLPDQLEQLEKGVHLAEGFAKATKVTPRRASRRGTILEITLREGRNREIRRLLAQVGHKVLRLKRIAIGPLVLGELAAGESRRLTAEEVAALKGLTGSRPRRDRLQRRAAEMTEQQMVTDFRGRNRSRPAGKKSGSAERSPSPGRALERERGRPRRSRDAGPPRPAKLPGTKARPPRRGAGRPGAGRIAAKGPPRPGRLPGRGSGPRRGKP
jgi:23S rRNA pseudouridine2605 synthase